MQNNRARLHIILRICFALHKDIEINFIPKCEASRGFKDVLSLFFKIVSHFVFIQASMTFHLLLNIAKLKFAPLVGLSDEDMDMDTMITTYNTAVTDAASEILGKERRRKKPWVTKDVLDLCDERRDLKKKRYEAEGAKEYREANRRVQKAVKKAKEDWIGAQCEEIETCLNKNNSKRAYQLVKDLTSEKQGRSSTIQDKSGKFLTEEKEILSR